MQKDFSLDQFMQIQKIDFLPLQIFLEFANCICSISQMQKSIFFKLKDKKKSCYFIASVPT